MTWKDLDFKERWTLALGSVHALATAVLAIVATLGLAQVAPILVYQIEQQQKAEKTLRAEPAMQVSEYGSVANAFVDDVMAWWMSEVHAHQRIVELIKMSEQKAADLAIEITEGNPIPAAPEIRSECLTVTATLGSDATEVVRIAVNEGAPPPTQYIQYKINHGAFADLNPSQRQKVEDAIARYMNLFMVPDVPPAFVKRTASLSELHDGISCGQPQRVNTIRHIRALKGIIDASLGS